jgi:radical SAM protein with 4Fe4S-binding SPASM domain
VLATIKRDFLKPFVHKTEGPLYATFYNILSGEVFRVSKRLAPTELREQLSEAGLIFSTSGVVPHKIEPQIDRALLKLYIRVLQIGANSTVEKTCWQKSKTSYGHIKINRNIWHMILEQMSKIYLVDRVQILGEVSESMVDEIKHHIKPTFIEINGKRINDPNWIAESSRLRFGKSLNINIINFFYSKTFNPCWGHRVAIDSHGNIKPCLWAGETIANIETSSIKDLIIGSAFDQYWTFNKGRVSQCQLCEFRYLCVDCRVSSAVTYGDSTKGPTFCKYNPLAGEGRVPSAVPSKKSKRIVRMCSTYRMGNKERKGLLGDRNYNYKKV